MNTPEPIPTNTSSTASDEIDLFALFETLWQGKWIIAACCAVAALLGLAYHFNFNRSITASITIRQLSPTEMSDLTALSDLGIVSGLTSENLLELNHQFLSSFENAKFLIDEYGLIEEPLEGEELRQHIVQLAENRINADLRVPRTNETFKTHVRLELIDDNREQLLAMTQCLFNRATEQQKAALASEFNTAIRNLEEKRAFEIRRTELDIQSTTDRYFKEKADAIEVLEDRIANLWKAYTVSKNDEIEILEQRILTLQQSEANRKLDRIELLREQIEIARKLGIEKPIEISYDHIPEQAIVTHLQTQS